jgi:hypothetical protein
LSNKREREIRVPEEQMNVKRKVATSCQVVFLPSYNTCNVASEESNYGNENFAALLFASV